MKIAVASEGPTWPSKMATVFGRCAYLLIFDTETGATEPIENPGAQAPGGAGVAAAQLVLDHGAQVLVAPKVGPQAHEVLVQADVQIVFQKSGTAGEGLEEARSEGFA